VDVVIYAACGERAGEVVEMLREFPHLPDPRTGKTLMDRTIIICNTSSMPVAAREASVYTAATLAAYYRQMGLDVLLLADHGLNAYSTLIETRREIVDKKPDIVQRFVDASAIGWYNYIYGDNSAGNAMIRKLNPEMTDELLAYSVVKMKEYGIVDSGDSLKDGIGAMSDERYKSFFDKMARAGVVSRDLDYRKAYTLRFVNKGVGVELRPDR